LCYIIIIIIKLLPFYSYY